MIDGIRPPQDRRPPVVRPSSRPSAALPPEPPQPAEDDDGHDLFAAKAAFIFIAILFVLAVAGLVFWLYYANKRTAHSTQNTSQTTEAEKLETVQGLELDPAKNYGDKYADGILPVGDKKFVTDGAKKGYVYLCKANFVPEGQAGATTRGPWFIGTTKWNVNKKYAVSGNVNWPSQLSDKIASGVRTVITNGLPSHPTGSFPVSLMDPAYAYDRNPNSIKPQALTYSLPATPAYSATPNCMGGDVGVILTGVPLLNGFDAGGRDAGAWEVQDGCDGHPQGSGAYHYHTLSRCIRDIGVGAVIGYALDGFPITGPKLGDKNYLTTSDLDECHGIVSDVNLDGKKVNTYHYVMTQDFPYSASCFRGAAARSNGGQQKQPQQQSPANQPLDVQGQHGQTLLGP